MFPKSAKKNQFAPVTGRVLVIAGMNATPACDRPDIGVEVPMLTDEGPGTDGVLLDPGVLGVFGLLGVDGVFLQIGIPISLAFVLLLIVILSKIFPVAISTFPLFSLRVL